MQVLIVRLGAFGDIVHTLPLAADLARAGHQVGWLCEDRWAPLLVGSAAVTRLHRLPRRLLNDRAMPWRTRLIALRRVVRELRVAQYDAVIDAQGLAKSALLALSSAARVRVGHAPPRARELSWLVSRGRSPARSRHVIDQQRELALALDPAHPPRGPWRFPLPAWEAERRWADQQLARRGLSAPWLLNVGAGWPTKVWPKARQVELVRRLGDRRQEVLLAWGTHLEHDLAEEILAEAGHGVLAPPSSIPQLAGLIARARVVISGDTGPLHLGLAVGTPAVGLFGPVPAERNGPRGCGYRNLQAPGAAWERRDVSKVDMGAISADEVLRAAHEAMAERAHAEHPAGGTDRLRAGAMQALQRPAG